MRLSIDTDQEIEELHIVFSSSKKKLTVNPEVDIEEGHSNEPIKQFDSPVKSNNSIKATEPPKIDKDREAKVDSDFAATSV